ncbi:MAG TPA: hypothetical protein VFT19_09705 [Solirubrobacterales bacterium]|nr:hypothetical protein [Solirubrobacterales bacterium]
MSEQATSTDPRSSAEQSNAELRREILRLRDLLIRKDAELGAAKGRLAELDDRSARVASAAARFEARLSGLGRLIGTALRMLQRQHG